MTNVCFKTLDSIKAMLKIFRKRLQWAIFGEGTKAKKRNDYSFLFLLI